MRVLGLHCGHDSSVAIVEDGKILLACEEERLTGIKKQTGFPARALLYACARLGIGITDFDKVVYSQKGNFFFRPTDVVPISEFNIFKDAVAIDHHYAHAVSAYSLSGFKDCLVMTLDGGGDDKFGSIYEAKDGKLTLVSENHFTQYPFGLFYNQITEICGFTANRHEGKVMGIAARGHTYDTFDGLFSVDGTQINSIGKKINDTEVEPLIRKRLTEVYPNWKTDGIKIQEIASAAQKTFEDIVLKWIEVNAKGRDLAVAGGCFANVLANMKISRLVNRFFVAPPMFDGGLSIGAAMSAFDKIPINKSSMYLGFDSPVERTNQYPARNVAEMIYSGRIIGLFQGRMEFGPRALGNRSIIADPRHGGINAYLNQRLKRSEFMPFAPVILEEYANDILVDYEVGIDNAPNMTSCWSVNPKWRDRIPAVVHIDGTVRPQVIKREDNPYYYDVVDEYRKLTGIPVLVNTSFNPHEEPIVCFRNEAEYMKKFEQIDVLVEA